MYYLKDPDEAAEIIRKQVHKIHGIPDDGSHLTTLQVKGLILERCEREGDEFLASDEIIKAICDQAQSMLLGSIMSSMAAAGELECAWDSESNDMVWWCPKGKS